MSACKKETPKEIIQREKGVSFIFGLVAGLVVSIAVNIIINLIYNL